MKRTQIEDELTAKFKHAGLEQPGLEARLLLQEIPDGPDLIAKVEAWAVRRIRGEPLAYLSGKKGFYKSEFFVESGVLVPRPETEHVVEVALERGHDVRYLADLGCGSGCLGLSLLHELPQAKLYAVDLNPKACAVTTRNAQAMNLIERVQVLQQSVEQWQPLFLLDLVVANPPYIAQDDPDVQPSVRDFEPSEALFSGRDGLDAIRLWTRWASHFLAPGGLWVCEFGAGQTESVREIMAQLPFAQVQIHRDLSGKERVVSAIKES